MLFDTLGAGLLGNMLTGKAKLRAGYGNKEVKGIVRVGRGYLIKKNFLIPPHALTNFEIQKCYQNDPRFTGVYSRDNFPKRIKDRAYTISLDKYGDTGTHWIALCCRDIEITYFDTFEVEHISIEIEKFIGHKNIKTNIFRIHANNLIMCGYFIEFIDFMFAGKTLIDFNGFFSHYDLRKRQYNFE